MEILFLIMIFVLGLCCGSFVNMLVYRTAEGYGLTSSRGQRPWRSNWDCFAALAMTNRRSFCDYCGKQLKWYENIPVVSWVIQKGKTRCCEKKLSVLYPIVEIITGVFFLIYGFLGRPQESPLQFGLGLLIIVFLVFSAMFDLKYMILPDFSTGILVASALVFWLTGYFGEWNYLWSALGGFLFLYFLYLITKKKGMGFGDVKLAIFMGLFLGKNVILAFYIAFVVGALVAIILMVFKKVNKKTAVSFGPFLILGSLVTWFFWEKILSLSVFQFIR